MGFTNGKFVYVIIVTAPLTEYVGESYPFCQHNIASTLSDYIDNQIIQVKWPNDVLINGKKIAGSY